MRDKAYYESLMQQLSIEHPFWNSTDIAYEIILQGILSCYWKSGEKIPQDQLATMLDMSRTPIRDACARLVDEDYLERNDKNICQVKQIKLKDYIDFSEFRQCLEAKAAYLAARNISDELLLELELNIERFKQAEAAGDLHRAMLLNKIFHGECYTNSCGKDQSCRQGIHNGQSTVVHIVEHGVANVLNQG